MKDHYPHITDLYFDFVNTKTYAEHPITKFTEPEISEAIEKAYNELHEGKKSKASDTLLECATTYEHSGFILGFTFAMNLMQESLFDKVQSVSIAEKGT